MDNFLFHKQQHIIKIGGFPRSWREDEKRALISKTGNLVRFWHIHGDKQQPSERNERMEIIAEFSDSDSAYSAAMFLNELSLTANTTRTLSATLVDRNTYLHKLGLNGHEQLLKRQHAQKK
jgi:hypothetical protein